jgi:hypothetical protein
VRRGGGGSFIAGATIALLGFVVNAPAAVGAPTCGFDALRRFV